MVDSGELLFGETKDHGKAAWIYARYAAGDHVGTIAADAGLSIQQVYEIMKTCPDDYEKTKQRREQFCGLRLIRSLSLIDAHNLKILEELDNEKLEVTADTVKELSKLCKDLAHRVQLYEGKATEIIKSKRDDIITLEEAEARIAEARAAGTGLDMKSIGGEEAE